MQPKSILLSSIFIILMHAVFAQDQFLSIENTIDIVKKYHPVVKQAILQNEISKNELTASKGVFDPSIQIQTQEKTFDNKLYYRNNTSELKIPLWYGIDVKVGIENNIGERLDPTLTKNNSSYVGISMDPFRGILTDKRNIAVKQAKIFVELTKHEQTLVLNDILLDAIYAYWNWVNAYHINALLSQSIKNNKERYEMIKKSVNAGDRAPIDTTEALTQLQTFEIMQNQSNLDLQKSRLELSNYFWTKNATPYALDESVVPFQNLDIANINSIELGKLESLLSHANQFHPKLKMLNTKSNILDMEKKIKTVELFPSLKLNYNVLENNLSNISNNIGVNNDIKYGLSLTLPLFQREARGNLNKTKNKIEDLNWDKKYYALEIENKVKSSFTEFNMLKQQINTNESILFSNKKLFETENTKFQMGESSLFLINNRELKWIETQQKHINLKTKFYQSFYKNLWAIGNLN